MAFKLSDILYSQIPNELKTREAVAQLHHLRQEFEETAGFTPQCELNMLGNIDDMALLVVGKKRSGRYRLTKYRPAGAFWHGEVVMETYHADEIFSELGPVKR